MGKVKLEKQENYLLAEIDGEFTLATTNELKENVKQYIESNNLYRIIIDLSQVEFIDSSGLGVLIAWFKMVNQAQGKIIYASPNDHVRKIIGFAKLDKIFTITETLEEAITVIA